MAQRNDGPIKRTIRRHQLREMVPLADISFINAGAPPPYKTANASHRLFHYDSSDWAESELDFVVAPPSRLGQGATARHRNDFNASDFYPMISEATTPTFHFFPSLRPAPINKRARA